MKKLLFALSLFISFSVSAQRMLVLPDTPRFASQNKGVWVLRVADNQPYFSNGYRWVLNTGGISAQTIKDSLDAYNSRIVTSFNNKKGAVKGIDSIYFDVTGTIMYYRYNGSVLSKKILGVDSIWRVSGIDSLYFRLGGIDYAVKDTVGSGGGGSGTDNTNAGSFFRILSPSSQALRTLAQAYGFIIDSTSNANALTFKFDTTTVFTRIRQFLTDTLNANSVIWQTDTTGAIPIVTFSGDTAKFKSLLAGYCMTATAFGDSTLRIDLDTTCLKTKFPALSDSLVKYVTPKQLMDSIAAHKDNTGLTVRSIPFSDGTNLVQDNPGLTYNIGTNTLGINVNTGWQGKLHLKNQSGGGPGTGIVLEQSPNNNYMPIDLRNGGGLVGQFAVSGTAFSNNFFNANQVIITSSASGSNIGVCADVAGGYIKFATGGHLNTHERMRIHDSGLHVYHTLFVDSVKLSTDATDSMVTVTVGGKFGKRLIPSGGGGGNFSDNEVPSGSINSSNVTFTLANTPITGSAHVYLRGLRQKVGTDYTISGATITFTVAPVTGDDLIVDSRY